MEAIESSRKAVLESRVKFLHKLKGVAEKLPSKDIEVKRALGREAVKIIADYGLGLYFSVNEFQAGEETLLRNMLIMDAYRAMQMRKYLSDDLLQAEHLGGRKLIIEQFTEEVVELTDQAIARYERLYSLIKNSSH